MALTLLTVGLILVPGASASQTACVGTYAVPINATLLNPGGGWSPSEATVPLASPIPAGDYTVTLVSFDDHVLKPNQSDQIHEQWIMELWDSSGSVVLSAGPTPDLPDDESWVTLVTSGTVTGEAVALHVYHFGALGTSGGNINSVVADCAIFEPVPTGSIGDTVWFDTDGNGLLDGGEAGIAGVTVTLSGSGPDVSTTTDADGMYLFDDLAAGAYTVTVGAGPTDTTLTTPGTVSVNLANGEDFVDADFGFTVIPDPVGSIGDKVWSDTNGDGMLDGGEFGIEGVVVTLDGPGGTFTTTTDGAGMYLFGDLPAGSYTVTVGAGPAGTVLSTVAAFTVDLATGENFLDADFGFTAAPDPVGTIGDTVWLDLDGNGVQDAGETGISGITVALSGPAGDLTTTTDPVGEYFFTDLPAGSYTVTVGAGPADTALSTAGGFQIDLAAGETNLTADFGFTPDAVMASLGDIVWFDSNENGVIDPGESGIAGVIVTLSGGGLASPATETTDASGSYLFTDLEPGTYTVTVGAGPINSRPTTPVEFEVTLVGGDVHLDADFGFAIGQVAPSAIIGDLTWLDSNLDGIRNNGEAAIAGVKVNLFNTTTGETISAVTSSSGQYLFSALEAGTYEVSVVAATAGDNLGLTTVGTFVIDLGAGESVLFADFGFAPQLPLTGLETADFGIAGIVLLLIGAIAMVLVRPRNASWHLVDAYEVR